MRTSMHPNVKKILILSTLLFSISSFSLMANEDKASIMIFDASGSMWGKLKEGRTKIEVAKEVVGGYLKGRDQKTPLGIIAYGHNRKGDCSDIEVIVPIGRQDSSVLLKILNKIKPKGKTPLTDSLALAVKQIPKTAEEADIILITDGLETCGKDPCVLAQKIADEGITIRAHVVGFGLSEKEVNRLSCIPEKTGGKLLRPQSSQELAEALKQVELIKSEPAVINMVLRVLEKAGAARPAEVRYSAKNLETNEVIDMGKTVDAKEVLQGLKVKLAKGQWLLMAKGPKGRGELEISAKEGEVYDIPYYVQKPKFTLKNYGPYQLGQDQSFLLVLDQSMQRNARLTAMLVSDDYQDGQKRIDWEFLLGEVKGIRELSLKSPKKAGKYKIVITPKGLKEQVASFSIEYAQEAKSSLTIPESVKPKEKFAYTLYGNWYRNNSLQIMQKGKKISDTWLQYTFEKKGVYLTAPEKEGTYDLVLRYYDHDGKNTTAKLAELHVSNLTESKEVSNKKEITDEDSEKTKGNNVYAMMQGKWILASQEDQLLHLTSVDKRGDVSAGAYYAIYQESESLGASLHEDQVIMKRKNNNLSFTFKTMKGRHEVRLTQDNNKKFFKHFWKGITPTFDRELWTGHLQAKGKVALIPVYLQKIVVNDKPISTTSLLYDLKESADKLIFTCKQASCTYNKKPALKGLPLLKDWAIEEPYFYTTAAGIKAEIPTIIFVNTKNSAWFILNPRQATDAMYNCIEFGKKGRLSSEEKICIPKGIPDDALGNLVTLQENVEFWRADSYEKKRADEAVKTISVGNVMSQQAIDSALKKIGVEK